MPAQRALLEAQLGLAGAAGKLWLNLDRTVIKMPFTGRIAGNVERAQFVRQGRCWLWLTVLM
ncbi:MAG: hypothetical protein R3F53_05710 [Gammaproteobacteria bacterium]